MNCWKAWWALCNSWIAKGIQPVQAGSPYIFTAFAKIVVVLYNGVCKNPKRLLSSVSPTGGMVRKFDDWWKTVPADLKAKARKGDEANKPLLNQVNYVLLHLHLQGKHDAKPSHEELKDWLHSGQVDVLRMNK